MKSYIYIQQEKGLCCGVSQVTNVIAKQNQFSRLPASNNICIDSKRCVSRGMTVLYWVYGASFELLGQ